MRPTGKLALLSLLGLLTPFTCQAASDEQKEFAFGVVERNAVPMARIGDSIYYFAELGMQEFESTRLIKDVLESGGFSVQLGAAGMPTNLWARLGQRPSGDRHRHRDRRAAGRLADARWSLPASRWCRARPATWRATTPMAASRAPPPSR